MDDMTGVPYTQVVKVRWGQDTTKAKAVVMICDPGVLLNPELGLQVLEEVRRRGGRVAMTGMNYLIVEPAA